MMRNKIPNVTRQEWKQQIQSLYGLISANEDEALEMKRLLSEIHDHTVGQITKLGEHEKIDQKLADCLEAQKELYKMVEEVRNNLRFWVMETRRGIVRLTPRPSLKIDFHLADDCNLHCRGCDHFSPLANQNLASLTEFKRDMSRLSELLGDRLQMISLLGGEPLLHPQAGEFAPVIRRYFPHAWIDITTNGILLPEQNDRFWQSCRENNVVIQVTKYPIDFDYSCMASLAEKHRVSIQAYDNNPVKTLNHIPLDLSGRKNPVNSFTRCYHANNCIMLRKGKLYPCTIAPNICHFNEYFNQTLQESEFDGIDIYTASGAEEVFQFLSKPIPFCRYCDCDARTSNHPWEHSKRSIQEWT